MVATASDKYVWLSYCQAIKQAIGAQPEDSSAVFFTTKAQKCPLASPLIPAEYSSYGIYNIADNLLAANDLFYDPSAQNSYIRSLRDYLGYVDLGGSGNEAVIANVVMAQHALDAAIVKASTELRKAIKNFQQEQRFGMTGSLTFSQWWPTNAPAYANAVSCQNVAAADTSAAIGVMEGPLAAQYQIDTQRIIQAITSNVEVPGITMAASAATPESARQILDALNSGQEVPGAKGIYYVPAYNFPEYVNTVKNWIPDPSRIPCEGANKISIQIGKGEVVDESSFGQTSDGGGLNFSYCPWMSFVTSDSSSEEEQLNNGQYTDDDVSITLTYDEIRAVAVSPGAWNIGNPSSNYPKLKPNAPITAKVLVAPTQLIMIKNLGYRIKFSDLLKTTFDKKIKSTVQEGGYVRVFGIPIQCGGFSYISEGIAHVGIWNFDSGEFVVGPSDEGAFASIVAIRGDKIKTT